jgi:glycosyltransferase involved in cell wall biosynthesis
MRIALFSRAGGLGGGETSLQYLADYLQRSGRAPVVVSGSDGPLVTALKKQNTECLVHEYRGIQGFGPLRWLNVGDYRWFGRFLKRTGAELAHVNDFESLLYVGPPAKLLRIPVVFTCHGWWVRERPWQDLFFEHVANRILAVSHAAAGCFVTANQAIRDRVTVIHLGVDTDRFKPGGDGRAVRSALDIHAETPVVAMVARFQDVKGHLVFLDAARKVLAERPDARFIVVGESAGRTVAANQEYERKVRQSLVGDRTLSEAVSFLGARSDTEQVLAASDLLVCPSDFESFGMVLIEAMACGKPVVSTNRGGPAETVVDQVTGFLVPPRDSAAIAARVSELLADPVRRRTMGYAARKRVESQFSLARYGASVVGVYRQLVARPIPSYPPGREFGESAESDPTPYPDTFPQGVPSPRR